MSCESRAVLLSGRCRFCFTMHEGPDGELADELTLFRTAMARVAEEESGLTRWELLVERADRETAPMEIVAKS